VFLNDERDIEYEFRLLDQRLETGYIYHGPRDDSGRTGTTYRSDGTPMVVALASAGRNAYERSQIAPRIFIPWSSVMSYKKLD
jgi:hypothetical protein